MVALPATRHRGLNVSFVSAPPRRSPAFPSAAALGWKQQVVGPAADDGRNRRRAAEYRAAGLAPDFSFLSGKGPGGMAAQTWQAPRKLASSFWAAKTSGTCSGTWTRAAPTRL